MEGIREVHARLVPPQGVSNRTAVFDLQLGKTKKPHDGSVDRRAVVKHPAVKFLRSSGFAAAADAPGLRYCLRRMSVPIPAPISTRLAFVLAFGLVSACDEKLGARPCEIDRDCPSHEGLCVEGACVAIVCATRSDCPQGICGESGICQAPECDRAKPCEEGFECRIGLCRSPQAEGADRDASSWIEDAEFAMPPPGFRLDARSEAPLPSPDDATVEDTTADASVFGPDRPARPPQPFDGTMDGLWRLTATLGHSDCADAEAAAPALLEARESGLEVLASYTTEGDPFAMPITLRGQRDDRQVLLTFTMPLTLDVLCRFEIDAIIDGTLDAGGGFNGLAEWHIRTVGDCPIMVDCQRFDAFVGERL